jgi:hypothetical protein
MTGRRSSCRILVEWTGKSPLGRRHRWDDNIKMNLKEIGWGMWIEFVCVRVETTGGFLCTWE